MIATPFHWFDAGGGDVVARGLQAHQRQLVLARLGLLHGEDVDVVPLEEGLDPVDAGAEGVDVPGGDPHPASLGAVDTAVGCRQGERACDALSGSSSVSLVPRRCAVRSGRLRLRGGEGAPCLPVTGKITNVGSDQELRGLAPVDARTAWVSGDAGGVWRDDGRRRHLAGRRTARTPPRLLFRDVEATDAQPRAGCWPIGMGTASRIYRTTDGGRPGRRRSSTTTRTPSTTAWRCGQAGATGLAMSDPRTGSSGSSAPRLRAHLDRSCRHAGHAAGGQRRVRLRRVRAPAW